MIPPVSCPRRLTALASHGLLAAAALAAAGGWLAAAEVTIALVAIDRDAAPLAERQSAWVSPFGGWVVATWPFGGSVGSKPLVPFATGDQQRLSQSLDDLAAGDDEEADHERVVMGAGDEVHENEGVEHCKPGGTYGIDTVKGGELRNEHQEQHDDLNLYEEK